MQNTLRQLDLQNVRDHPTIVVVGKRATGKTTLINQLLTIKNVSKYQVFDPLIHVKHEYPNSCNTYDEFEPKTLQSILQQHKKELRQTDIQTFQGQWVIVDNAIFKPSDIDSTAIREVFMNGRCLKMGLILSMAYPLRIRPDTASNIDYVFVFRDNREENIKRVYEIYLRDMTMYDTFLSIFKQATSVPYSCLVIDFTKLSNNIEDVLYMYEPPSDSIDISTT